MKRKVALAVAALAVFAIAWEILFCRFSENSLLLFPSSTYEIYALTDNGVGGFSTSELSSVNGKDSSISARVNIRSGMAYPYAGIGLNLLSVNHRPAAGFFDFSKYDSMAVRVETGRMKNVTFRFMNNDPVYSRQGVYVSYRPLVASIAVPAKVQDEAKISLSSFSVPDWWLAGQGLENDDGLRYMQRGALLEIYNGEGTLRGIPDEITLYSVRFWGVNRDFKNVMYLVAGLIALAFAVALYLILRNSAYFVERKNCRDADLKKRMDSAAEMLKGSDRSLAEIALAIGEKNEGALTRNFCRIYGEKPLDYRRKFKKGK